MYAAVLCVWDFEVCSSVEFCSDSGSFRFSAGVESTDKSTDCVFGTI